MYGRVLTETYRRELSAARAAAVQVLVGARQTGKTSLARAVVGESVPDSSVTIDLTTARERQAYEQDPGLLARRIGGRRQTGRRSTTLVLIDEFQRVPALLDEVQALVDSGAGKLRFLLTGSSSRKILRRGANLLPGRSVWKVLFPVTPEECGTASFVDHLPRLLGLEAAAGDKRLVQAPFPARTLSERIVLGVLPGLWGLPPPQARELLRSYALTYLEEEIRLEALVKDLAPFSRFLELAAVEAGQVLNYSALSQETGRAVDTIKSYYEVLRETHVTVTVPAFSRSARKQVLSTPRVLFFDLGVRNAIARQPLTPDLERAVGGRLFEQWVGITLHRWLSYHAPAFRLTTWRTRHGAEVDYVIDAGRTVLPIEVKYGSKVGRSDLRGLRRFLDEHPRLAPRGLVVFTGAGPEEIDRDILAVPALEPA
jgi:predicted AAA+ superfamily ATPase